ncbi:thioredoxin domain-containing protein [Acidicapsa dinghuensis]|uniref:Thioredoxin domain-containing protein n=1 Tax=Acidicapsa dinghuensis TaxID=2218256 RepID=A0ABW1EL20_9BACT|nr:thioredoxin domain-containing protein [Acidicapsa dinghuensis]
MAIHESPLSGVNRLDQSRSAYLKSARHQPVMWRPWGEEAFAQARAEDKPILLDIGAVWCHWCHVMDRESYENPEIAAIINEHFVAVKVDRDERPDVDARYQAAVSAISGQGGWPLTAFLTPDGQPYFGGTYFPPDDRYGRPGLGRVLLTMAQVWRERREEALDSAASVMGAIEQNENFSGRGGTLTQALVDKIADSVLKQFDPRFGGFGSQPKFPHPAAIDLLIEIATRPEQDAKRSEQARNAAQVTLTKMSQGGVYDQLAGGFHRYSVDERWVVPHFEKMLYDNTELLRNYVHAYQSFVKPEYAHVASEIIRWLDGTMTDRERGGFYASQDADIDLDDDGDYFTWTKAEAQAVLTPDEWAVAGKYWDIGELGDMHHNPQKNVLHVRHTVADVAQDAGIMLEEAVARLSAARTKLMQARQARPIPYIDRTLYTGWNAMAVTAYLEAARALRLDHAKEFALKTLDRLLVQAWDGGSDVAHVIAYAEEDGPVGPERVPGVLDDYAFLTHAATDAWLATGKIAYYRAAMQLAQTMIARFYDKTAGAFVDTPLDEADDKRLGALTAKRKPLQDTPTPAGNPTAASALLRLEALSGRSEFREIAEDTLESFAGIVEHFGLYAGSYALALQRLLHDPVQVVIVGRGEEANRMQAAAMARFAVNKTVIRLSPRQLDAHELPEALAGTVGLVPVPEDVHTWALLCTGRTCTPPVLSSDKLAAALQQ